ncbi:IS256 family transposase [Calditrichota bacterium GD2]
MAKRQDKDNSILSQIQQSLMDDSDFLRALVEKSLQKILDTEFENFIQASPYERTEDRRGYRNGSYPRYLKTRVGKIELRVLRDREGNFSTELFSRYQRNEKAFVLSMIEMYLQGVSTRKVSSIVEQLCGSSISKSMVSELSKQLDNQINTWRNRPLTKNYPYLIVDARYEDIRESGVVSSQAVLIVIGISAEGKREILSVEIGDSESEQTWRGVFKRLRSRGLRGVLYAVSDDNKGLVKALKTEFQGVSWQRCQVHFMRNFLGKISKKKDKSYILKLKDVFNAPDIQSARSRKNDLVKELSAYKPKVSKWLDDEIEYCFTVYGLPEDHRRKMRSTNMIERLNQEILRRSRVVRIFPNRESCLRLIGAICMEQSEAWQVGYRYLDMSMLKVTEGGEEAAMAQAV